MKIDRKHCQEHSRALHEGNDCTVYTCSIVTQIEYPAMHAYLAEHGRKPRKGLHRGVYMPALEALGVKFTKLDGPKHIWVSHWRAGHYRYNWRSGTESWIEDREVFRRKKIENGKDYGSVTVTSLAKELTKGTYMVHTDGHVLALVDGVVHDWTEGRRHRIESVYKVELS